MKELIDMRISDPWTSGRLESMGMGQDIGYGVKKVVLDLEDPRLEELRNIFTKKQRETGSKAYNSAFIYRRYSRTELENAKALRLIITAVFEPPGEETGTVYDDSKTCHLCGAGRIQRSDLILDLRQIPKNVDIARTIANEWIINDRLADLLLAHEFVGYKLGTVHHCKTWFGNLPAWHQLLIIGDVGPAVEPTVFGIDPFDLDYQKQYRCPVGHVAGLNLISELYIKRETFGENDIGVTSNMIGYRSGLLFPFPLVVISQRFYKVLRKSNVKGYRVEVVQLI